MNIGNFNILERYYAKRTLQIIFVTICLITTTFIISLFMYTTMQSGSTGLIRGVCILLFIFAPCLFEKQIDSYNSTIDFLLPASQIAKYMHFWVRYYIIVPATIILSLVVLFSISDIVSSGNHLLAGIFTKDQSGIWLAILLQPVCFTSYFLYKKNIILKTLVSIIVVLLSCALVILAISSILPNLANVSNLLTNPLFVTPPDKEHIWLLTLSQFFPIPYILGLWITSYQLMKERGI